MHPVKPRHYFGFDDVCLAPVAITIPYNAIRMGACQFLVGHDRHLRYVLGVSALILRPMTAWAASTTPSVMC